MRKQARHKASELRIVGSQHDKNQNDGIDQHPVIGEGTQQLGKNGKHRRGDDGTADISHTAEHDKDQHKNRGVEVKLLGHDR